MLQIYQNHVVFQSFSDMFYIEQQQQQQRKQAMAAKQAAIHSSTFIEPATGSSSAASSPASSRAPSLLFHDLSRRPSESSSTRSNVTAITAQDVYDGEEEAQYYPAGLENSSVERRRLAKEADMVTLADGDMPLFSGAGQDLSLQRY